MKFQGPNSEEGLSISTVEKGGGGGPQNGEEKELAGETQRFEKIRRFGRSVTGSGLLGFKIPSQVSVSFSSCCLWIQIKNSLIPSPAPWLPACYHDGNELNL